MNLPWLHEQCPPRPGTLSELPRGRSARIVALGDRLQPSTARRLCDLGLVPGVEVSLVRSAPLRDPAIYRVADYEIALRRTETRRIRVEPLP